MSKLKFDKVFGIVLGTLMFLLILAPNLLGIGVILLIGTSVFGIYTGYMNYKWNVINISILALYLAYFIGSFFSNHPDIANKYLEYKLALVLFPVLFSFVSNQKALLRIPVIFMIAATAAVSFIGLVYSVPEFIKTGNVNSLLSINFSFIHHPTYFSMYASFCCAALIYGFNEKWKYFTKTNVILGFTFFVFVQFLCVSLAGVIFVMCYLSYLIFSSMRRRTSPPIFIGFVFVSFICMFGVVKYTPELGDQLINTYDYVIEYSEDPDEFIRNKQTYVGGSETRLILWTAAFKVMKENPFGVGTGNVDDAMSEMLIRIGQPNMSVKKLNPHNQFFQTGVEIGSLGLFILLFVIFFGIYYAIRTKNWLLLFILINLAFNCLFESMLQRQSGIVFYAFWICLLMMVNFNDKKTEIE